MNNIIEPTIDYNFSKTQLGIPVSHPGSTYVARIFVANKPLYMQTPKCTTRSGIVKSGKKLYCDLMFSRDDSIFIDWITNLEEKCQALIFDKSESWFQTSYSKDEIETAFSSSLKVYKSGNYYLLRVGVRPTMKIYNDLNVEVSFDGINEHTNMINIIEFYGIRFTSRNFQIDVELKQSMIVSPDEFVGNCFIKAPVVAIPNPEFSTVLPPSLEPEVVASAQPHLVVHEEHTLSEEKLEEQEKEKEQQQQQQQQQQEQQQEKQQQTIEEMDKIEEIDFDIIGRLEESEPLYLKRPSDPYYKEYNELSLRANNLKLELQKIYLEAQQLKKTHSLNVPDINDHIDISEDEEDEEV